MLFAVLGKPGTGGAYSGPGGMRVQEDIFQQALRLLYERRLEQLGLSAAVTVTERKGGQPAGPSP